MLSVKGAELIFFFLPKVCALKDVTPKSSICYSLIEKFPGEGKLVRLVQVRILEKAYSVSFSVSLPPCLRRLLFQFILAAYWKPEVVIVANLSHTSRVKWGTHSELYNSPYSPLYSGTNARLPLHPRARFSRSVGRHVMEWAPCIGGNCFISFYRRKNNVCLSESKSIA